MKTVFGKGEDMESWRDTFANWARAWAALSDLEATDEGSMVLFGTKRVAAWPSDDVEAHITVLGTDAELVLITEDSAEATQYALSKGLKASSRQVLLQAETGELDLQPNLPSDAYLAEAPMENYDLVELALFDRPVGSGRLSMGEGLAVVSQLDIDEGHDEHLPVFEHAIVAGLGDEAFAHGADIMFLIASEEQAQRFATLEGWTRVAEVLSFTK